MVNSSWKWDLWKHLNNSYLYATISKSSFYAMVLINWRKFFLRYGTTNLQREPPASYRNSNQRKPPSTHVPHSQASGRPCEQAGSHVFFVNLLHVTNDKLSCYLMVAGLKEWRRPLIFTIAHCYRISVLLRLGLTCLDRRIPFNWGQIHT